MFKTKEMDIFDLEKIENGAIVEFYTGISKTRGIVVQVDFHNVTISPIAQSTSSNDGYQINVSAEDAKSMRMEVVLRGIDYAKKSLMSIDYEQE